MGKLYAQNILHLPSRQGKLSVPHSLKEWKRFAPPTVRLKLKSLALKILQNIFSVTPVCRAKNPVL